MCSLLGLGGGGLGGDLGQKREEAEEHAGPPELHTAAAAAAACGRLGQGALAAGARATCLKAAATRTSVQETLPKLAAGVPKKKILQKEEGLGATKSGCCSGNTHPASWPRPLKQ